MKTLFFKIVILLLFISVNFSAKAQPETDPFIFDPDYQHLGDVWDGDQIEFSFDAIYVLSTTNTYFIDTDYLFWCEPWITSVEPEDEFTLTYYGDGRTVTISGTIGGVINLGLNRIDIVFRLADWSNTYVQEHWVYYNYKGTPGIEDYIEITSGVNSFSEGDLLDYEAHFYDMDPLGDEIEEWNLEIKLTSSEGEYTYVDFTNTTGPMWTYWTFIAPNLPEDMTFTRNEQGQIYGILKVTGHDTDGYDHTDVLYIGINKEPDPPVLHTFPQENNTVKVVINNSGGTNNLLYYDTDSGEPYTGTGLMQGNSPISMGSSTNMELEGFQDCSKYYFAAKSSNQYGTSDYSNERELMIFSSSNGMPIHYHFSDCYLQDGYELEDNHYFIGNLIIESGTTITFEGGTLYFEEDSKIIIEPGGKLILDGATCTAPCGQMWAGVEVWGDFTKSQYECQGEMYQGKIILQNGATIEHAEIGVLLGARDLNAEGDFDDAKAGGIIQVPYGGDPQVQDAYFKNNKWAIRFWKYQNFTVNPVTCEHLRPAENLSFLKNCTFDINTDYLGEPWWFSHVHLFDVNGIDFYGCTFVNNKTADPSGHGINAYGAGFTVKAICNSQQAPCPEEDLDKCTFTYFKKAINNHSSGTRTIYVSDANFLNNSYGIQLNNVDNATVLFSNFYIEENPAEEEECEGEGKQSAGYGIDLNQCTGFAIEENYFTKATGAPLGNYIGIRVTDCPSESDVIYRNEFTGVSVGNQAEGYNRPESGQAETGITYYCNQNTNNNYDFYVADNSIVGGYMGWYDNPSGNTLSSNAQVQFQNDYTEPIIYFYNENEPDEILSNHSQCVYTEALNDENTCPSHYGGGGGTEGRIALTEPEKQAKEADYLQSFNDYNGVQALYTSLLDGGNTEALKSDVATSWPDDMWELRAELLGKSPHLSKEVLMIAADKTEVLPESVLFEILSANPDELRKEELISYLENKQQPLPQYMIDILKQLANGISYKTILLSEMATHHAKMIGAAQDIIRSILNEEETDIEELRNWLDNISGIEMDKQIIETYITEGDYSSAQSLLDMLPALYELSGDELLEYNDYKSFMQLVMNLDQQGRTIFELNETELASIVNLAEYGYGSAKTSAQGILEFAYDYDYCNCPNLPENIQLKSSTIDMGDLAKAKGLDIIAEPNPVSAWAAFDYTLPLTETEGKIEITDNSGKIVQQIDVVQQKGQYILDTRSYKAGIYYYTLICGNLQRTGKLIVK
ncbi:MAG: T9SS type A sorting domain-containing protein [Bacteroidetes bacterium]|nr:T9SS type A sorting domain-containing protein [Bacteroidota bacterium]MBL7104170.1 T9SS type A sorting domain-containing protein [Bacteroidales bacterium]